MIDNKNGYNVNIENYSNLISHIAVQGPKSEEIIRKLGMEFPEAFTFIYTNSQKHNAITESDKIIISGTGYTGEKGSSHRGTIFHFHWKHTPLPHLYT